MKLGVWIEPEMASVNSNLLRNHSHWCLGVKDRFITVGRHQMALDLSNPEVREYIFETLSSFLRENPNIEVGFYHRMLILMLLIFVGN